MDLLNTEIRRVAKPRDPILAKQIESILERVEIYPPECDDMEEIEGALNDYGMEYEDGLKEVNEQLDKLEKGK